MINLTKRELQIMECLWNSDTALSSREITEIMDNVSQNTVKNTIKKLLDNKLVKVGSIGQSGTVLTRQYVPILTRKNYISSLISYEDKKEIVADFITKMDNKKELKRLDELVQEQEENIE